MTEHGNPNMKLCPPFVTDDRAWQSVYEAVPTDVNCIDKEAGATWNLFLYCDQQHTPTPKPCL